MRLTRMSEYAVLGLLFLAQQDGRVVYTREVSENLDLPTSFLAKAFQKLARAGILKSHRGSGGGFSLVRPAGEISLAEILAGIQDNTAIFTCTRNGNCDRLNHCGLSDTLTEAQVILDSHFQGVTLDQLAASTKL